MVNFHRCETHALRSNEAATKLWSAPSLASDSTSCPAGNVRVPAGAPFAELKVRTTFTNAGALVWCPNLWRCRLVPWDGGLELTDCEMIPAKNAGAVDGCPLPVAGPVTLAVARLAVPATTPAASAADPAASSAWRAARVPASRPEGNRMRDRPCAGGG